MTNFKSLLMSLVVSTTAFGAATETAVSPMFQMARLRPEFIMCPRDISDITLFHASNGFWASRGDNTVTHLHNYNVDKQLLGLSHEQIAQLLLNARIKMTQSSNGEVRLEFMPLLRGGGTGGAWLGATLGFGAVQLVFNGFYGAVGVATTAIAGPIVGAAVSGTVRAFCLPVQAAASKTVALAAGIALGTATGPV